MKDPTQRGGWTNPAQIANEEWVLGEYQGEFRDYEGKPKCTDCDKPLSATDKLALMPDGTTAGTYPQRPVCHDCESVAQGKEFAIRKGYA